MIYLDNAATTKINKNVKNEIIKSMDEDYGNASSLYDLGINIEKKIKNVKDVILSNLHARDGKVIFTSGGTEGNNLLIKSVLDQVHEDKLKSVRIITSVIEHSAVSQIFRLYESMGVDVVWIPVDTTGMVNIQSLEEALNENTILVSIMGVNNEIGSIQNLELIGKLIKNNNSRCVFHTDFVQGFMKIPIDVEKYNIDAVTICAHKICGPKGVGALYVKNWVRLAPLFLGGGQEGGIRSGTENNQGIIGFGASIMEIDNQINLSQRMHHIKFNMVEKLKKLDNIIINGEDGSPYILSISIDGIRGEVLLHALERRGVYISTGSACSSHKKGKNNILSAINLKQSYLEGTIRISFSYETTLEEVETAAKVIIEEVCALRNIMKYKNK